MSLNNVIRQHKRVYGISRVKEATFGELTQTGDVRIPMPAGAGAVRKYRTGPTNAGQAHGGSTELVTERYPSEKRVDASFSGIWLSTDTLGLTCGYGFGHDAKTSPDTGTRQHLFSWSGFSSNSDSIGSVTMITNDPDDEGSGSSDIQDYNGMQLNSFSINFTRSGHPTIDWEWIGAQANEDISSLTAPSLVDKRYYIPNNKVSFFIVGTSSEHTPQWGGSFTQPSSGVAVTSSDLSGSPVNITAEIDSLSLSHNNNLDIDAAYGAGTGVANGALRREAYYTTRSTTGSITFKKVSGVAGNLADIMDDLFSETEANEQEWSLQIIGTTDYQTDSDPASLHAGFSILVPLLSFDPYTEDTQAIAGATMPFTVKQNNAGTARNPIEAVVWEDANNDNVFNQA